MKKKVRDLLNKTMLAKYELKNQLLKDISSNYKKYYLFKQVFAKFSKTSFNFFIENNGRRYKLELHTHF